VAGYRDQFDAVGHLANADYLAVADAGHYLPLELRELFRAIVHSRLARCT
jgi:hypothetical protein